MSPRPQAFLGLGLVLLASHTAAQTTRRVPGEFPTITAALAAAQNGDTILVAPGTYAESLLIQGRDVVLRSEAGPGPTTIRGDGQQSVIRIMGAAITRSTRIEGFRITGGFGSSEGGGLEVISGASPVIARNIIEGNRSGSGGGGIAAGFASPRIEFNLIRGNQQFGGIGGIGGAGISIRGASTAEVIGNIIEGNRHGSVGGGIVLFAAGSARIEGNLVRDNEAPRGAGIAGVNLSGEQFVQNLIVGNRGSAGAGLQLGGGASTVRLLSNTIAGNLGSSTLDVFSLGQGYQFHNNIVAGDHAAALVSSSRVPSSPAVLEHNLWFNATGAIFDANGPAGVIGVQGNLSADPRFVDPARGDFHIELASPARDAGTQQVPGGLTAADFWGQPRIADGPVFGQVDIGADEDNGLRPYGRGCAFTTPYPAAIGTTGVPNLGNANFAIELRAARPAANCVLLIGVSRERWGNLALPWDLASLGMSGCVLQTSVHDAPLATTDAQGSARLAYPLPANPAFRGLRLHAQWLVAGPGALFLPGDLSDALMVELR
jgi:hypothetical protein